MKAHFISTILLSTAWMLVVSGEMWLLHELTITNDSPHELFQHPLDQRSHTVGYHNFWSTIQVDKDGQVWANQPFPYPCMFRLTQDGKEMQRMYSEPYLPNEFPGFWIGQLERLKGEQTVICMSYCLDDGHIAHLVNDFVAEEGQAFVTPI
ncbi:hypothetical protein Pst134EB_024778 [Puccinia striiformis f. sp. tritici]|nr:hypothetical protein Pst134EB_024778 [Puccinia striiformis f. sp. tritici]